MTSNEVEFIELLIEPIPPETLESVRAGLPGMVRESLSMVNQEQLLDAEELQLTIEETAPDVATIALTAVFALATDLAVEVFKVTILPEIKKRYHAVVKRRKREARPPSRAPSESDPGP